MCKEWLDCFRTAIAWLTLIVVPPLLIFIIWLQLPR